MSRSDLKVSRRVLHRVLTVFCLLFLTSGCAFGTRYATLGYEPLSTTPAQSARHVTLSVAPLKDQRARPAVVGHVLNTWGMKTAKVVAKNDVAAWVREALVDELRRAGFTVVEDSANPLSVSGAIVNIDCESYFTYEGTASLSVQLKRNGTVLLDHVYTGEESEGLNWAATARSYAHVLESALRSAVLQIVHDIERVLAEHPS